MPNADLKNHNRFDIMKFSTQNNLKAKDRNSVAGEGVNIQRDEIKEPDNTPVISDGNVKTRDWDSVRTDTGIDGKKIRIKVQDFNFYYGKTQALKNINIEIKENAVVGIIGPSGCGKSTFLRCFNRMNDIINNARYEGEIFIDNKNIFDKDVDAVDLRRMVGMVFQKSNPFPKTIFENVAYGLRINAMKDRNFIAQKVEKSLKDAALWDEVKDRLYKSAFELSGGQQQRLCIARALAVEPEVLLLDEPASALDPIATAKIEELMYELKKKYTIIIVTHNMQQAARVSEYTAFFMLGELIEYDETNKIFTNPANKLTEDYVTGRFG